MIQRYSTRVLVISITQYIYVSIHLQTGLVCKRVFFFCKHEKFANVARYAAARRGKNVCKMLFLQTRLFCLQTRFLSLQTRQIWNPPIFCICKKTRVQTRMFADACCGKPVSMHLRKKPVCKHVIFLTCLQTRQTFLQNRVTSHFSHLRKTRICKLVRHRELMC